MAAWAAAAQAGASLLSGVLSSKGAKKAAKIQAQAIQSGIDEQRNEFNQVQQNEQPFIGAGTDALASLRRLLGLGGAEDQASAIGALKESPLFTSQFDTGRDAILQSAAATGGLRGGNTQNSLAQFGSGLLASVLQGQIGNLGGLVTTGQNAAGMQASTGQNFANSISGLLTQQGGANALGAIAPYAGAASGFAGASRAAGSLLQDLLSRNTGGGGNGGWNPYANGYEFGPNG